MILMILPPEAVRVTLTLPYLNSEGRPDLQDLQDLAVRITIFHLSSLVPIRYITLVQSYASLPAVIQWTVRYVQ